MSVKEGGSNLGIKSESLSMRKDRRNKQGITGQRI